MSDQPPFETSESLSYAPSASELLVALIDNNPRKQGLFEQVVERAQREEGTEKASVGYYGSVPFDEMVKVAESLRDAKSLEDKYKILSQTSSKGELWYDVVLGRVNDKALEATERVIDGKKWKRGLDIGTGPGNSLLQLKKHADNVVGVDKKDFLLQTARTKAELKNAHMAVACATKLPFADRSFGIVISNGLTYYIPSRELAQYAQEVERVLQPGGSYYEAFTMLDEGEVLPRTEQEYLTSGKGVLACLMDRLVTWKEKTPSDKLSPFKV